MPKPSVKEKVSKAKKFDRNALKNGLTERVKASYEQRDSFGSSSGIFLPTAKFTKWIPKIGDHLLDIIPYIVGKKDPKLSEGEVAYCLEMWVHYGVGPNEGAYACPTKNYNRPCPVCEHQKKLRMQGAPDDEIKALYPKRRCVYNIVCRDSVEEENKGVQIWEVSHFHSEKHFSELARKPKGGGFLAFTDPDNGKMVFFNKVSKMEVTGHRFVERDEPVADEFLEQASTLDELIYEPTYKELWEAFYGGKPEETATDDEETEEEKPRRKKPKVVKPEPEDEDSDEDMEEESEESDWEEEPEPAPKKKKFPQYKPEVEPEDEDTEEESEESDWEEEEEEPAPKKKSKSAKPAPKKKAKPQDDDEDWDD